MHGFRAESRLRRWRSAAQPACRAQLRWVPTRGAAYRYPSPGAAEAAAAGLSSVAVAGVDRLRLEVSRRTARVGRAICVSHVAGFGAVGQGDGGFLASAN